MHRPVALIPAKGFSRRLRRKNFRPLLGRPLLDWTIAAAVEAKRLFRAIVVSTDCDEIARWTEDVWGHHVKVIRRAVTSYEHQDTSPTRRKCSYEDTGKCDCDAYISEFVDRYHPDPMCFLQPTCPLRTSDDIVQAFGVFDDLEPDYLFSVRYAVDHPSWLFHQADKTLPPGYEDEEAPPVEIQWARPWKRLEARKPGELLDRRPIAPNGAIYLLRAHYIPYWAAYVPTRTAIHLMPPDRSIDIDDKEDFLLAEAVLTAKFMKNNPFIVLEQLIQLFGGVPRLGEYLGISHQTIYNWVAQERIPNGTPSVLLHLLWELHQRGLGVKEMLTPYLYSRLSLPDEPAPELKQIPEDTQK